MLTAAYVVGALAIIGAIYVRVAREDEQMEGWTDLEETRLPRTFGRLDKQEALDRTNAHYQ
jgi:hypothetical protein